ncbi:MAG: menaquinone-dependent protoporphyrinogen IX dehydrogenase [Steroidobacteraceae bacterium]|nr:menaquinone-dependent protoporphyrinogen IX dehydrogenase [Steroidobacteraceae bacterium]
MARILLLYWSGYGQTRRICERIQALAQAQGHAVDVAPIDGDSDPAGYDAVVIGASIRHGKHDPSVLDYIRTHQRLLESKPSGFFSVNLVARKPAKNRPETNPYVKAFVASSPWKPRLLGVFGGELDYQRYGAFDRAAIRFIMWLTKGPRDPNTKVEFTDWAEVERFAGRVAALGSAGNP